jgi:hypothetical protein
VCSTCLAPRCSCRSGDERWIEVKPPNQDLLLVLSPRRPDEPRRTAPDRLPHSDLFFDCADIEQTYAQLGRRGVKFPVPPVQEHFGWWALFEDNESTRYALGQSEDQQCDPRWTSLIAVSAPPPRLSVDAVAERAPCRWQSDPWYGAGPD